MMNENISVYDILDENSNALNSQVLTDNVCFEIPSDYYFNKEETSLAKHKFCIMGDNNCINLCYENCDEKEYDLRI